MAAAAATVFALSALANAVGDAFSEFISERRRLCRVSFLVRLFVVLSFVRALLDLAGKILAFCGVLCRKLPPFFSLLVLEPGLLAARAGLPSLSRSRR